MRLDAHYGMLPEHAFEKRGFGNRRPATLEGGGKGGGGGGPQTTTAYQTNLPEYAKPYVMNMLGAAQNQLFTTSPGTTDPNTGVTSPGEITGFRPYQPYSTDPTKYFAAPTGLQQGVYNEAAGMQTPGQFGGATGLAGAAGLGQLGTTQQAQALGQMGVAGAAPAFQAGQQYMQGVTDPSRVGAFMSPYQQQVTDIAKAAAIRDAQMLEQGNRLAAARQGTYGGARQALASLERERNLATNLANIQAQGSQSAYDRALAQMQFGSNLGLQGIQTGLQGIGQGLQSVGAQQAGFGGAGQAAATLGGLGTQQQQADLARMGFQQQTGAAQQQYQQNIINQAIQDYATAQQYPYMQLSTMSNLLRGLPMQSMSTQIYQAQPSMGQQALGLLGTGASLYGAFGRKEGGQIKEYAAGGGIKASLQNRIDDIAEAGGVGGLKKLMTETQSPEAKKLIAEKIREMGIAAADAGNLGQNMAGGGIVAFADGGDIPRFFDGGDMSSFLDPTGYGFDLSRSGYRDIAKEREEEARRQKEAFLAENAPEALAAMRKREAEAKNNMGMTESSFKDFDQAQALFEKERFGAKPPAAPATPAARQEGATPTGLAAIMEQRNKLLGFEGPGEKSQALMKALEERSGRLGKEAETDRYLRMAQAFAQFGSTAGPIGKAAAGALGEFAKGEGAARKEQEKMQLEVTKMQADIEKAQRAEKRGDLEAAEKFYNSAEDRQNRINVANASANRQVELIERAMKDPEFMNALRATKGLDDKVSQAAMTNFTKWESGAALTDPEYRKRAKAAKDGKPEAVQAFNDYREQKYNEIVTRLGSGSSSKTSSGSGKVINYSDIK